MSIQEVAGNHGVAIWGRTEAGFATDPVMVELSLIFVSARIQVQMDTYPRWCAPFFDQHLSQGLLLPFHCHCALPPARIAGQLGQAIDVLHSSD